MDKLYSWTSIKPQEEGVCLKYKLHFLRCIKYPQKRDEEGFTTDGQAFSFIHREKPATGFKPSQFHSESSKKRLEAEAMVDLRDGLGLLATPEQIGWSGWILVNKCYLVMI